MCKYIKLMIFVLITTLLVANNKIVANNNYEEIFKQNIQQVMSNLSKLKNKDDTYSYLNSEMPKIFSFKYISLWSLGNYAKQYSKEEIDNYVNIATNYMIFYYGSLLVNYYNEYRFEFLSSEQSGPNEYLIFTKIIHKDHLKDQSKVSIDATWKLRYNKNEDKYYIVDIIINTISFLNSQRAEFESILKQNNGDLTKLNNLIQAKQKNQIIIKN